MRNLATFLLLLCPLFIQAQCNVLVWSDEFDGTSLNTANWNYEYGAGGWGNSELQYYTDDADNISVSGGILTITAENDPNYNGSGANFTSARITTRNKQYWTYGRMEARIRLPQGRGLWPAFWMLDNNNINWPVNGEIDIMEYRGDLVNKSSAAVHYGDYSPNNLHDGSDYYLPSGNFYDDYHIFAIEWEVGEIRWYVDGNLFKTETESPYTLNPPSNHSETWPWDNDFFIILNMAVGGWYTGTTNENDIELTKPTLEVDYVRVYSDPISLTLSGHDKVFENQTTNYTAPSGTGYTFNWSVPSGATITSGQSTDNITVDWGDTSSSGDVHCDITPPSCSTIGVDLPVTVFADTCQLMFIDYDNHFNAEYYAGTGVYTPSVANPSPNVVNSSSLVAKYDRNAPDQWDAMKFKDILIDDAIEFENGDNLFKMDVYTSAPLGTTISINMENEALAASPYPSGRRSTYNATTLAQNAWHTLTFSLATTPDLGGTASDAIDNLVILFDPGNYTGHTFYFDNFHREQTASCDNNELVPVVELTGKSQVLENYHSTYQTIYDASYSYSWTVPSGATIVSGAGTNQIEIEWGSTTSSGNIQVEASNSAGSTTDQISVSVIENSCELTLENFDGNSLMSQTFSDGTYTPNTSNPGGNAINSSANVASYVRNAAVTWDVLAYDEAVLDSATHFESGDLVFQMDVRTDAPIGTQVLVQLENTSLATNAHPAGRRSSYSATTTAQNQWEKLVFTYTGTVIDPGTGPADVNRVVLLFDGGNNTNDTYFFDNFKRIDSEDPACNPTSSNPIISRSLSIYPNPTQEEIHINGLEDNESISIINTLGQVVMMSTNSVITVRNLPTGVYRISTSFGRNQSFIKE